MLFGPFQPFTRASFSKSWVVFPRAEQVMYMGCHPAIMTMRGDSMASMVIIRENQLSGKIPDAMVCMTLMSHVNFFSNRLSGKLPDAMASWTRLVSMEFDENRLSCT